MPLKYFKNNLGRRRVLWQFHPSLEYSQRQQEKAAVRALLSEPADLRAWLCPETHTHTHTHRLHREGRGSLLWKGLSVRAPLWYRCGLVPKRAVCWRCGLQCSDAERGWNLLEVKKLGEGASASEGIKSFSWDHLVPVNVCKNEKQVWLLGHLLVSCLTMWLLSLPPPDCSHDAVQPRRPSLELKGCKTTKSLVVLVSRCQGSPRAPRKSLTQRFLRLLLYFLF